MQRINRILAFASVSFVLIFIAKINKVGLYTAYFKTIAEVEVRNSQDLALEDLLLTQEFIVDGDREAASGGFLPTPDLSEVYLDLPVVPQTINSHYSTHAVFVSTAHFFRQVEPRAPTA